MEIEKKSIEKIRILYVDDESHNLTGFKATFRKEFEVVTVLSAKEAQQVLKDQLFHIIITDQRMPETTGIEFLESIIKEYPDAIRILLTGYSDMQAVIDAINKGQVYKYIMKPWSEDEIRITVHNAYEVYKLKEENKMLLKSLLQANEQLEFMIRQKLLS